MIESGTGNLLRSDVEALVNSVNCVGVMGKGVALQFKLAFPANYRDYVKVCRAGRLVPGSLFVFATGKPTNPKYIINFPTKRHWRERSHFEYIRDGLDTLLREVRERHILSIAIPALGCGNGGLEWAQVRPMIERAFAEVPDVRVILFGPETLHVATNLIVRTTKPELTRSRALLVAAFDIYESAGYGLTLLEAQKLVYFLQMAGEPLRLEWTRHKYGPYAEALNHVLQRLEGHFINGYGDRNARASIRLAPDAAAVASEFLTHVPDAQEHLRRVGQLIEGFETPYAMELLAMVYWVTDEHPEVAADPDAVIERVRSWSERKRALFSPQHIRIAWQRLRDTNWLGSPAATGRPGFARDSLLSLA